MPTTRYEADSGDIHQIRMSAARIAVAGDPPAGAVSNDINVKVSKTNREFGLRPRGVVLGREIGAAGDVATKYAFLPVLTPAAFATPAFAKGAEITYDGETWEIKSRQGEDF